MAGFEAEELARTELVAARYLLVSTLGEGGMGRVHRAYDTKLRREVALKFHKVEGAADLAVASARARLVREAQVLAKLAHPHVVTVYDVGEVGEVVFVAMELVEGETLRVWQSHGRGPNAVLEAYIAAGEGLAAAHRAGVQHRDFKPENVMVGNDGRVRVVDFGLARSVVEGDEPRSLASAGSGAFASAAPSRAPADSPTEARSPDPVHGSKGSAPTSSGIGTPRYMAPEQWLGRTLDARADQYSFCVALYEALEGRHPLLASATAEGGALDLRVTAKVPARSRLASVLTRGLAVDPDERFPSMDDLLRALRPPRRRAMSAVVMGVVVTVLGIAAWRGRSPCAGSARHWDEAWNAERRARIEASLHAADASLGPEVFHATATALERFGARWTAAQKAAMAARVDGTQSEAMLDRRTACLEEQLASFRALTSTLSGTLSAEDLRHAAQAANGLPSVETCADASALLSSEPLPVPAAQRAEVDALEGELRAGWAARLIGRDAEALTSARHVAERGLALGHSGLIASARALEGDALVDTDKFEEAVAAFRSGLPKAVEARNVDREIRLLTGLFDVLGQQLARHDSAQMIADVARAGLGRPGVTDDLRAFVDRRYGLEVLHAGAAKDARLPLERALALGERLYGEDSLQVAEAKNHLSIVLKALGDYGASVVLSDRAAAIYEERLGPHSIDRGKALTNSGTALKQLGRYDEAISRYRQALEIWEPVLGPDHTLVATAVNNIGSAQLARGQIHEGEESFRRALAISERAYGPDHPVVARTLSNLANILMQTERTDEALRLLLRSAAIFDHSDGSHPGDEASTFINLGQVEATLGRERDAQAHYERAVRLVETKMSPTHRLLAYPLIGLAELFLAQKKPALARAPLERLRAFVDTISIEPSLREGLPDLYRRAGVPS